MDERADGRTTEPAYTISSPGAFGSGDLKIALICRTIRSMLSHGYTNKKLFFSLISVHVFSEFEPAVCCGLDESSM